MGRTTISNNLGHELVVVTVDDDIDDMVRIHSKMYLMLDRVEESVHNQVLLNLRRGWCSSVSGKAFKLYCMLATAFQFPVFAVGRASQIVVSCPADRLKDTLSRYEALWALGKAPNNDTSWRNHYFGSTICNGPMPGWHMIFMNRPNDVDIKGLIHTGGWDKVWDVVPMDRTLDATSAVQRKEVLEVDIN